MEARGGKRRGAGRPKGAINKATEEARHMAALTGELPLEYMLRIMRDPKADTKRRDAMAIAASRFCHHTLTAVEHTGRDGGPIEFSDARDRLAHLVTRETASDEAGSDTPTTH